MYNKSLELELTAPPRHPIINNISVAILAQVLLPNGGGVRAVRNHLGSNLFGHCGRLLYLQLATLCNLSIGATWIQFFRSWATGGF